jgi:hypothetical protein
MDANRLLADLARLPWAPPHHIQVVMVDYEDEEALLPLDVRLMRLLPPIHGPEFALPIRDQGLLASFLIFFRFPLQCLNPPTMRPSNGFFACSSSSSE